VRAIRGSGCTIAWTDDGRHVAKQYDAMSWWFLDHRHEPFERERRVGTLLRRQPPPVQVAHLVRAERRRRTLYFEAIDGAAFGPKFPLALPDTDVDALVGVARAMRRYRPRAAFARRFDPARRVQRAVRDGLLSSAEASALSTVFATDPPGIAFGHGDITARNVLRSPCGAPVLIDWEWAGLYPRQWDLAFLWFSLLDVPGARARVERQVSRADEAWFWRSALLVQLLHLSLRGLAPGSEFRAKHERGRDELLERVL
jgi:hypothetical protein